ncbi:hypothetical protein [Streptomyces luteolus]|uniref:AG2 protein n=1 Tax=Streptomyces luteolus TaxID=3043615 RepID=A0ABT6SWB1_9ACTN|nr:hypothetical protein [Streptomyces sp. B-S-A12]MDI3419500.1 hypothetical protein [Streptomyces sp. B-S-A12]
MIKRLEDHWEGEAARKGFAFMRKAKQEYEAAAVEARRIAKLLEDTHDEFKRWQKALRELADDARKDHYKFDDKGGITDVHPRWETPTAGKDLTWKEERQKQLDSYADRLKQVLMQATAADVAADMALRHDPNGSDNHGFNRKGYASGDAAEAAKASDIAKKAAKGEDLSKTELNQLNNLLKVNRNDPDFAAKFATDLGPRGTVQFWNNVGNPQLGIGEKLPKDRQKILKQMQENLGTTLGTATRTDGGDMQKWKRDLVDLGPDAVQQPKGGPSGSYGFQVASNLMRYGEWDNAFLEDYGKELVKMEKGAGMDPDRMWDHPAGSGPTLNIGDPNDRGTDPMTGYMEALGNSRPELEMDNDGNLIEPPEIRKESAATTFFSDQENYEYLMDDRKWVPDGPDGSEKISGYNELGHALEAATTGHPYDEEPKPVMPHSDAQVEVMQRVIHNVGEEGEVRPGMGDSLGRMSSEYMPDFNRALTVNKDNVDEVFPLEGNAALPVTNAAEIAASEQDASRFLATLGEDPDAFDAVNIGQTAYSSNLMDYHMQNPDSTSVSTGRAMEEIAYSAGTVDGLIGHGRQEAELKDEFDRVKEENEGNERIGGIANGVVSGSIGIGVSFVASPVAGAAAAGAASTVTGDLINQIVKSNEGEGSTDTMLQTGRDQAGLQQSTEDQLKEAYSRVNEANGSQHSADASSSIGETARSGFDHAGHLVDRHARDKQAQAPG